MNTSAPNTYLRMYTDKNTLNKIRRHIYVPVIVFMIMMITIYDN